MIDSRAPRRSGDPATRGHIGADGLQESGLSRISRARETVAGASHSGARRSSGQQVNDPEMTPDEPNTFPENVPAFRPGLSVTVPMIERLVPAWTTAIV